MAEAPKIKKRLCSFYGIEVKPGALVEQPIEGTDPIAYSRTHFENTQADPDNTKVCLAAITVEAQAETGTSANVGPCRRCGMRVSTAASSNRGFNEIFTR